MFVFAHKMHIINFLVCSVLCASYFISNFAISFRFFSIKMVRTKLKRLILISIVYSFVMSLPLMPFVWEPGITFPFSNFIMYLFMASCIIWQLLKYNLHYKIALRDCIIPVSLGNISGWVVMGLFNYWFYYQIAAYVARFFA